MCQVSPVAVYVCCIGGGNQIRWCGGVTGVSTLDGTHGPLIRSVQAPTPAPTFVLVENVSYYSELCDSKTIYTTLRQCIYCCVNSEQFPRQIVQLNIAAARIVLGGGGRAAVTLQFTKSVVCSIVTTNGALGKLVLTSVLRLTTLHNIVWLLTP